jgi:Tol biopolymer transport system component
MIAALGVTVASTYTIARTDTRSPATVADTVAAELFLPGVMSTPMDELNAAFTPDGRELYWSLNTVQGQQGMGVIVFSRKKPGGAWGNPELATFSGQYSDYDPFVAPDGQRLFFISNRPKGAATWNPQDFDIYLVERKGEGWSEPVRMDAPVNSDAPEYYPSVAANGDLFFSTTREGSKSFDIFRSRFSDGQYQQPENLGEAVNGTANTAEIDNYVAPDQSFIVFAAFRQGGIGGQDLFISFKQGDGWSPSQILPKGINSPAREYTPIGSPDGRYLYFTSMRGFSTVPPSRRMPLKEWRDSIQSIRNGNGNLYRVPLSALLALRPNP